MMYYILGVALACFLMKFVLFVSDESYKQGVKDALEKVAEEYSCVVSEEDG